MKITLYNLLGMIKDGKAPKKIKAYGEEYVWNTEYNSYVACDHDSTPLFNKYNINRKDFLTDEVEILDELKEDKIKKLYYDEYEKLSYDVDKVCYFIRPINKLIDEVNKLKEK